jgi:hypothetical protein
MRSIAWVLTVLGQSFCRSIKSQQCAQKFKNGFGSTWVTGGPRGEMRMEPSSEPALGLGLQVARIGGVLVTRDGIVAADDPLHDLGSTAEGHPAQANVSISFSSLRPGRAVSDWRWLLLTKPIRSYRRLAASLPSITHTNVVPTAVARKRSRTAVSIPKAIPERRYSGETQRYSR